MKKIILAAAVFFMLVTIGCSKSSLSNGDFVKMPDMNLKILKTEVTQKMYESVMGQNPSEFKGESNPVEMVSWYDAIYFCNKLSLSQKLVPVYSVDGSTDVNEWDYTPHQGNSIEGDITQNKSAPGYRLPTMEEWEYAARGGKGYEYSGSDDLDEVGWYKDNSEGKTHPVAEKKANAFGLYDMSGNVDEWCWDSSDEWNFFRSSCGGCYDYGDSLCTVDMGDICEPYSCSKYRGFRVVCQVPVESSKDEFVEIPGKNFMMSKTEVTQYLYNSIMGQNPSEFKGGSNPVEMVSWYDAIYFCNKLSLSQKLVPVYSVDGSTDVNEWDYTPHQGNSIEGDITQNTEAKGFRLPTKEEWQYAAKGGKDYEYAGSDNLDEVGWYESNSGETPHPVAEKRANDYGLYDMSGNVWEWVWDAEYSDRFFCGGSFYCDGDTCWVGSRGYDDATSNYSDLGFRLVCPLKTLK